MVHEAARAFHGAADRYERGRPSYPLAALRIIANAFAITPASTVVDLAAGTGKFTRLLLTTGARVIAVEPVEGMRDTLKSWATTVDTLDGTAEALPLVDDSADVVTVAQAFHWFSNERALDEIHRVLRPSGGLALVWNRRDVSQPLQAAISDLLRPHSAGVPSHTHGRWRQAFEQNRSFTLIEEWHVPYEQEVDADRAVDRVTSISYIASLPDVERRHIEEKVRSLTGEFPAQFSLKYITDIFCYRAM